MFDPESTQKEVYEDVGKPVLKDVLQGYNGSILAYGQTGAGKTHSLLNSGMGIDGKPDPKQAGLLPRLVAALFVHMGADATSVYTVEASMLQIYNEQIDCLLGEDREKAQGLQVTGKSEVKRPGVGTSARRRTSSSSAFRRVGITWCTRRRR